MSGPEPTIVPSRSPWQAFYRWALRRRRALARAERLPRPVVSLGNLHWGGGGKTPITAALARHLLDRGLDVTVLTRGYGRSSRGPVLVSRGRGPEVGVATSGDEAAMLARIPGLGVVAAERRLAGGLLALDEMPCDVFLLDDGFSHVRLHRDLDLLLFPHADPFAGGRLLPGGRLREPLEATVLADGVLLTGAPSRDPGNAASPVTVPEDFTATLHRFGWRGPTFASESRVEIEPTQPVERALLVCAVARPSAVEASARELARRWGFELTGVLSFPDHHSFTEGYRSIGLVRRRARAVDTVLVTGKDHVKLAGRLDLEGHQQLVEMELEARPESGFWSWLEERTAALLAR